MFEAFGCRDLGGESFLAVDFQTSCDTSQYNLLVGFGVLGVFVYPIAIPAGTIFVLYQNKAEITERGSEKFDRCAAVCSSSAVCLRQPICMLG